MALNSEGIETFKSGFHKWEEIEKYEFFSAIKSAFLKYKHSKGEEHIEISRLSINNGLKLSKILMVYKERNKLQNSKKQ